MAGAGRVTLTQRRVESAVYTGQRRAKCVLWDSQLPGFGLRVHPTGAKAFVVLYRIDGRQRTVTLGPWPALTVDAARRLAREQLGGVATGRDPAEEKRQRHRAGTFAQLADAFLNQHSKVYKRSARNDVQRLRDYCVAAWGPRKADSITRADVMALVQAIGGTKPVTANRVKATLSKLFNWGETCGLLPEGHANPCRRVPMFPEHSRERFLSREEVGRLMREVERESSVHVRAVYWLALLLGLRRGELLGLRWSMVDFERGLLTLPSSHTKQKRTHVVPLSGLALDVLRAIPRDADGEYVFPGAKPGTPLYDAKKSWDRVREAAGLHDVHFHDLRRTVGSWVAQGGASLHLVGSILGHSNASTSAIYARFRPSDGRDHLDAHARQLLEAAGTAAPRLAPDTETKGSA